MRLNQGSFALGKNKGGIPTTYCQEVKIKQKFTFKLLKNQGILVKDLAHHKAFTTA